MRLPLKSGRDSVASSRAARPETAAAREEAVVVGSPVAPYGRRGYMREHLAHPRMPSPGEGD
jgi:hypothetical protein